MCWFRRPDILSLSCLGPSFAYFVCRAWCWVSFVCFFYRYLCPPHFGCIILVLASVGRLYPPHRLVPIKIFDIPGALVGDATAVSINKLWSFPPTLHYDLNCQFWSKTFMLYPFFGRGCNKTWYAKTVHFCLKSSFIRNKFTRIYQAKASKFLDKKYTNRSLCHATLPWSRRRKVFMYVCEVRVKLS